MNNVKHLENAIKYLKNRDHSSALDLCEELKSSLYDILQPHLMIKEELDDQYEDPEMWDNQPLYLVLKDVTEDLCWIDNWYDEEIGYDDDDIEKMNQCTTSLKDALKEYKR